MRRFGLTGRYSIFVTKGRKVVERHYRNDYDAAMRLMDALEETLAPGYGLEFKDSNPFG